MDLRNRVVAIMGGSRGLGLELARVFIARGARVALCARDQAELDRARDLLDGKAFVTTCDVGDRDSVYAAIVAIRDEVGDVDVLVNCAGIVQCGPLDDMTAADFEKALQTNLWGPIHATLAVLPSMRARKQGRIVNIASVGGRIAVPHLAPYSVSKFGLVGFSEALRSELASEKIFVTTVCPGLMRTGSARNAWFKGQHEREYAWFATADSLSVTSISAERAAKQIVRACECGDADLVISWQAKLATFVHGIAPGLVQELLGAVAGMLPGPTASKLAVQGKNADSKVAGSRLTRNGDEAAVRNNELGDATDLASS